VGVFTEAAGIEGLDLHLELGNLGVMVDHRDPRGEPNPTEGSFFGPIPFACGKDILEDRPVEVFELNIDDRLILFIFSTIIAPHITTALQK